MFLRKTRARISRFSLEHPNWTNVIFIIVMILVFCLIMMPLLDATIHNSGHFPAPNDWPPGFDPMPWAM